MSSFKPTPDQELAINTLDRDVSISAGAGSGKTAVLVHRFCRIVEEEKADVDEILTVTFTEKAAREMKQRIVARFAELSRGPDGKRFEHARRKVEAAYIGTIHSFAARVLKENSFDAGVDPRFRVLDEMEAVTIKDGVIDDLLAQQYEDESRDCVDLLMAFGRDAVKTSIKALHSHASSLGTEISLLQPASTDIPNPRPIVDEYVRLLDALIRMAENEELTPALQKTVLEFRSIYGSLKAVMCSLCDRVMRLGADRSEYVLKFDWDLYEETRLADTFVKGNAGSQMIKEEYIGPAKLLAEEFRMRILEPLADYYIGCLCRLTSDFRKSYGEAKRKIGVLDFDDLLLKTRDMLAGEDGNSGVAQEYRAKFKYIFMDEFQDTNSLQKSIIDAVCPPDSFFTVGDMKQSIYGFNNAEVGVFIRHHNRVKENGNGKALSFTDNFRSRPEVLGLANWLFDDIWSGDGQIEFERLKAGSEFHEKNSPSVEIMLVPKTKGMDTARLAEARAIARRIRQLLGRDGSPPLQITRKKEKEPTRDIHPGDIMVLFRSTADIPIYERALSDAGIEYYVVSGRGFFETHEVTDVLSVLKVVENPLDDISMASALRSPTVGVSDDALWWLTRDSGDGSTKANRKIGKLFEGLGRLEEISGLEEPDRSRLLEFRGVIRDLQSMSAGSRISDLLSEVLKRTRYDVKLLSTPNGKRKYANICKLMDLAREFQSNNLFFVPDFIRHIENLKVLAGREGEAATETEESRVVRLMTVHKAKGLEAPVVFVADTARGLNVGSTDPFIFSKDLGVSCKLKNHATDDWERPIDYQDICDWLAARDMAEEKRLFYVAATRAEELLILSGCSEYKEKKNPKNDYSEIKTWAGWLEKAFGIVSLPDGSQILQAGESQVLIHTGPTAPDENASSDRQTYIEQMEKLGEQLVRAESKHPIVKRCYAQLGRGQEVPLVLSTSRILDFLSCPRMYYCRWVLGIEDARPEHREYSPEEQEEVSVATLGSAVHQIMRAVDFTRDVEPQFEELISYQDEAVREAARRACGKFLRSGWLGRIRNGSHWLPEVPLRALLGGYEVIGRADLVFREGDDWLVIDYKTGSGVDKVRYRQQVGIYALAMECCLGLPPSEVAIVSLGSGSNHSEPVTRELLVDTRRLLDLAVTRIRNNDYAETPSDSCEWCGYKGMMCGCE